MSSILTVQQVSAYDAQHKPSFKVPWYPSLMANAMNYRKAADETAHVTPCKLAAVNQRETRGQNIFQIGMPHEDGCGVGDFQITSNVIWTHPESPTYPGYGPLLDRLTNARVAAHEFLEPLARQFPNSTLAQFAGFNLGGGGVAQELARGISADAWTTDHDYGLDCFTHYINFVAASSGLVVDWTTWRA